MFVTPKWNIESSVGRSVSEILGTSSLNKKYKLQKKKRLADKNVQEKIRPADKSVQEKSIVSSGLMHVELVKPFKATKHKRKKKRKENHAAFPNDRRIKTVNALKQSDNTSYAEKYNQPNTGIEPLSEQQYGTPTGSKRKRKRSSSRSHVTNLLQAKISKKDNINEEMVVSQRYNQKKTCESKSSNKLSVKTKRRKKSLKNKELKNLPSNLPTEGSIDSNQGDRLPLEISRITKSSYKINKLKEICESSPSIKKQVPNESIFKKKRRKDHGTLRERMMKKLRASRFRYLNEQLYTSAGKDAKEYFESDPKAFQAYHEGFQQQVKEWPINPLDIIISSLKGMSPELIIADFGCGDARLARSVPNKVHSFDLISTSKEVTACNMSHTPLSNASVDVVVFCLSLMGNELTAYITEANRVLKEEGLLKVAEVESRFDNVNTFILNMKKFGFENTSKNLSHNLFYFLDFQKEKCIGKKTKKKLPDINLRPCLYKKR